jgi:hypothetical protein
MVGRLLVSMDDGPNVVTVIAAAKAAGVHWVGKEARRDIDFCLALTAANSPLLPQFRGERMVFFSDFSALLTQHQAEGTSLRELLLMHLFKHEELNSVGSTYQFSLARNDELQDYLCSLHRTNLHQQSGAPFLEGTRECDREPAEFPLAAVRGAMKHVGSGTLVFAKSVAASLPGGESLAQSGNTITIVGDVGQQVNGDQTVTAPMTFIVGGKRK